MDQTAQRDIRINKPTSYEKQKKSSKNESTITKMKPLFTEKKILHLKESITFQSKNKCCKLKKLLY